MGLDIKRVAAADIRRHGGSFDGEDVLLDGNSASDELSLVYVDEKLDAHQRIYIVPHKIRYYYVPIVILS